MVMKRTETLKVLYYRSRDEDIDNEIQASDTLLV